MRKSAVAVSAAALLAAGVIGLDGAAAAPFGGGVTTLPDAQSSAAEPVAYFYRGHDYCWYYDGWHGPGWYWCGYEFRRGIGWGSPVWGWNSWAWSGPRFRDGDRDRRGGPPMRRLERRGDRRGEGRGDRR